MFFLVQADPKDTIMHSHLLKAVDSLKASHLDKGAD